MDVINKKMKKWGLGLLLSLSFVGKAQIITTVPGTSGVISDPAQLAFDRYGNLYCGEGLGNKVIKIDTSGVVSVFAGTGATGYGGDGGPATAAVFNQPAAVATDSFGNVYIGDGGNNRVRKVDVTTGIITTIAGTGTAGFGGDGGPAVASKLFAPGGLYFDKYENLYITDDANFRIRKIDVSGIITTIAGNGTYASAGDGGPATAAECYPDYNMCTDALGNLYFIDNANNTVRKIDTLGIISTIAGDSSGAATYVADGVPALGAPMGPAGIAFNEFGELVISDDENNRIRLIDSSGIIHTVAGDGIVGYSGDGGSAVSAEIGQPVGITFDHCGNLYIAEITSARIRKVTFNLLGTPSITISPSPGDTVCAGTSVTYSATVTGSGTFTYKWVVNGTVVSTSGSSYTYTPANGDSVRCIFAGTGLCSGHADTVSSNTVHMVVTPFVTPTVTLSGAATAVVGSTVTVTATIAGAGSSYTIEWFSDGVLFATTTAPTVTYTVTAGTDSITATVIPSAGCYDSATSAAHTIASSNEGVINITALPVNIYPNPAHNEVIISGSDIANITITNPIGQTLLSKNTNEAKLSIDISSYPAGIYLIKVTDSKGGKTVSKIVKK